MLYCTVPIGQLFVVGRYYYSNCSSMLSDLCCKPPHPLGLYLVRLGQHFLPSFVGRCADSRARDTSKYDLEMFTL